MQDLKGRYDTSKHPDVLEGRMTPDEALADFAKQWDDENAPDGKVTPAEFLEYYKDVSASIDRDDYFELMMRNGSLFSCCDRTSQFFLLFLSLLQRGTSRVAREQALTRPACEFWSSMTTILKQWRRCRTTLGWTKLTLPISSDDWKAKESMISKRFLSLMRCKHSP